MESMDSGSQALAVRYIQKPQDGHADTVAKLSFSPSYVTYNPVTIQNVQSFFNTGEVSPSTSIDKSCCRALQYTLHNMQLLRAAFGCAAIYGQFGVQYALAYKRLMCALTALYT